MDGVKEDIMELKSAVNAEMMVLKAEVAKSGPTVSLPECPICMQDMVSQCFSQTMIGFGYANYCATKN